MKKSLVELQRLEEQKLREEIKKIDNAEEYYELLNMYDSLAYIFFIMNILIIILALISDIMIINVNANMMIMLIISFVTLSLICLLASVFYEHKTMKVLQQHYEAK